MISAPPATQSDATPQASAAPGGARAAQVELILSRIEALPPLSTVATELLACSSAAQADMAKIIRLIESDPSLSMRVLKLCRGASTGLGDRITTVKRAVLMLGFDVVRSAALSISIYQLMNPGGGESDLDDSIASETGLHDAGGPLEFDRQGFWEHCVATACCAEVIAQRHPKLKVMGAEAFLAGLLHGIGKFVMAFALPKAYGGVIRLARQRRLLSADVEMALLGVDYYVAGKHIGERWGLPAPIVAIACGHGQPLTEVGDDPDSKLNVVIIVAKAIARWMHAGWSGDYNVTPNPVMLWNAAGLDPTESGKHKLRNICGATLAATAERFGILGMTSTSLTAEETAVACINHANQEIAQREEVIDDRNQSIRGYKRVVDAMNFMASGYACENISKAAETVTHSASLAMEGGTHAIVCCDAESVDPWTCYRGQSKYTIAPPHTLGMQSPAYKYITSPRSDGQQVQCTAAGLMDWLHSWVHHVLGANATGNINTLRILTLTPGGGDAAMGTKRFLLVSNRDLRSSVPSGAAPLVHAWWQCLTGHHSTG